MTSVLLKDRSGSSAAEFALILPLLLLFMFGIIDGGRFLWEFNRAEKATQAGARFAVVSDPIAGGLLTADYLGVGGLTQGDLIPASALGKITCTSTTCTCTTGPCPALGTHNAAAFTRVVTRMRAMMPDIQPANVRIVYEGSGLGYAGDPHGMDISPLVTVELMDTVAAPLEFVPITTLTFARIDMPSFRTSLTSEDASGQQSN